MGILAHYTSVQTLESIVDGKSMDNASVHLFATQASFLNDPTENEIMMNYLNDNYTSMAIKDEEYWTGYPFSVSFSELLDDLNQWRVYGDDGSGVALIFAIDKNEIIQLNFQYTIDAYKVEYMEDIDTIIKELKSVDSIERTDVKRLYQLYRLGLQYKIKYYEPEQEWRIVAHTGNIYHYRFRYANGFIIPYVEIELPIDCIAGVKLGPCISAENRQKVYKSVNKLSHDIKITESQIPYRPLSKYE